jgi:hypothetical protein
MQCPEFDALLSQAIDGTLSGEKLESFAAHGRECQACGELLEEAEAGRSWLKSLGEVAPPPNLVESILVRTSGVRPRARETGPASWMGRLRDGAGAIVAPLVAVARQPRFAMSFGMAFFSLSATLSLAGVRLRDLRHLDLRPSAIRRTYYETSGRVVKYYENIRFVYEIESRVRQLKQATTPAEQQSDKQENHKGRENKSDRSGEPNQREERNYSQEGDQPVFASLPDDPPVVPGATYRRFA